MRSTQPVGSPVGLLGVALAACAGSVATSAATTATGSFAWLSSGRALEAGPPVVAS